MAKKKKKRPQGRSQHRPQGKAPTFKQQLEATAENAGLTKLPTPALVATIDTMIGILRDRGIKIRDWDEKDKVVEKMKCIGGKVFILAPIETPGTEAAHGENGEHGPGQ